MRKHGVRGCSQASGVSAESAVRRVTEVKVEPCAKKGARECRDEEGALK